MYYAPFLRMYVLLRKPLFFQQNLPYKLNAHGWSNCQKKNSQWLSENDKEMGFSQSFNFLLSSRLFYYFIIARVQLLHIAGGLITVFNRLSGRLTKWLDKAKDSCQKGSLSSLLGSFTFPKKLKVERNPKLNSCRSYIGAIMLFSELNFLEKLEAK